MNTQEVKDLVRTRFGGSLGRVYLNKCYNNKVEMADRRNMAFMTVSYTHLTLPTKRIV